MKSDHWFYSKTKQQQAAYIKAHPTSIYAKKGKDLVSKTKLIHEAKIQEAIKKTKQAHSHLRVANSKLAKAEDDYEIKISRVKTPEQKKKVHAKLLPKIKKHHAALKKAHAHLKKTISKHNAAEDNYEIAVSRASKQAKQP